MGVRDLDERPFVCSPVHPESLLPHVLLVDDEPGIRFVLRRWFERQHWAVSEAGDGQSAMTDLLASDEASDSRFDLVVCDLHLPLVSGEELMRTLAASRPALAARVILSTGDAVEDAPPGTLLASHPHVLQKPFELAALKSLVASIVTV
jgi:CheY-like chemotaxis protein